MEAKIMNNLCHATPLDNTSLEEMNIFQIYRKINATKSGAHSISRIRRNAQGKIFAGKCNCGKGVHHLILKDTPDWEINVSSKEILKLTKHPISSIVLLTCY